MSTDEELIVGHQWDFEDSSEGHSDKTPPIQFSLKNPRTSKHQEMSERAFQDDPEKLLLPIIKKHFYGSKFRYIIAIILIAGNFFQIYTNQTLAVASVSMVSSSVLDDGLNQIRIQHGTWGPSGNIAAPGTCPLMRTSVEVKNQSRVASRLEEAAAEASLTHEVHDLVKSGDLVDWTMSQRTSILSSNSIGATLGYIAFCAFSFHHSASKIYTLGLVATTMRAFLFPAVASHAPYWLTFTFELIMGAGEIVSYSVHLPLISAWFVPEEANVVVGLYFVSCLMGSPVAGFISSQLIGFGLGWTSCFYFAGIMSLIVLTAWMLFATSWPEHSTFVSEDELVILHESVANKRRTMDRLIARQSPTNDCFCDPSDPNCPGFLMRRIPVWRTILTCPTIWALTSIASAIVWLNFAISLLPTFMASIQHASTSDIGWIMGLRGVVSFIYGAAYTYLTRKFTILRPGGISLTAYRRLSLAMASLSIGIIFLLLMIFDCSLTSTAVAVMILPIAGGFHLTSFCQMPLDISPEDSGLILSIVHFLSFPSFILGPFLTSWIFTGSIQGTRQNWHMVWLLIMVINLVTGAWFSLFARAEPKNYTDLKPVGKCKSKLPPCFENTRQYKWHMDDRRYV